MRLGRRSPPTDALGWRDGHPLLGTLGNMVAFTIPEIAVMNRHMRDCLLCRGGWQLITGSEWEVPKGFKAES